jgi:hypothetical protein
MRSALENKINAERSRLRAGRRGSGEAVEALLDHYQNCTSSDQMGQ